MKKKKAAKSRNLIVRDFHLNKEFVPKRVQNKKGKGCPYKRDRSIKLDGPFSFEWLTFEINVA